MKAVPESMIQSMQQKGFTYLGIVENEVVFCNLENEESVKKCLSFLESITGEDWDTSREETGNRNLVFYRKSMFQVVGNYLRFRPDSDKIELPLNCSSCYYMFYNLELPEDFTLGDDFDTSKVTNMGLMFRHTKLPKGFTLGDKFDTSNVTYMPDMFYGAKLPEGFTLGDKFDTSNVENMEYMFSEAKLPEGFTLGDKFDTSNVKEMRYMFCKVKLPECFTLGDKFDTSKVINITSMFENAKLPEGKSDHDFDSAEEIIDWLKSRKPRESSVDKLSAF